MLLIPGDGAEVKIHHQRQLPRELQNDHSLWRIHITWSGPMRNDLWKIPLYFLNHAHHNT